MSITTLASLQTHLQWALELELSTLPPYLTALYSLQPGSNPAAAEAIRAVAMEEMLHMVLVANVLNAVGGTPVLDEARVLKPYPQPLPHGDGSVIVGLARFSPAQLSAFMRIERPEAPKAPPEPERYHSIGQFYDAIAEGLRTLNTSLGAQALFSGNATRQIDPTRWYYNGGGQPIVVHDLDSALAALAEIKAQGEGSHDAIWDEDEPRGERELAHFYRFEQIRLGRAFTAHDTPRGGPTGALLPVDWAAVLPMRANPKVADYADQPEVQALMRAFNQGFTRLLKALGVAFSGQPALLYNAVPMMFALKSQALALMNVPCAPSSHETVGPSFEWDEG